LYSQNQTQQAVKVEPFKGCMFEAPVVQVVSVNVGDRSHFHTQE